VEAVAGVLLPHGSSTVFAGQLAINEREEESKLLPAQGDAPQFAQLAVSNTLENTWRPSSRQPLCV
jgi:hypothetical protein